MTSSDVFLLEIYPQALGWQSLEATARAHGVSYYTPSVLHAIRDRDRMTSLSGPFEDGAQYHMQPLSVSALKGGTYSYAAQLKALYPVRSWLPWFPSIMDYNRERNRFIAPFLANYEMVRMAQALVLPEIRRSIGLHERAMAIRSASTQLGSGFEASGVHTSSLMRAPLSIAQRYLESSSDDQL
jgi:hypothetical protein